MKFITVQAKAVLGHHQVLNINVDHIVYFFVEEDVQGSSILLSNGEKISVLEDIETLKAAVKQ